MTTSILPILVTKRIYREIDHFIIILTIVFIYLGVVKFVFKHFKVSLLSGEEKQFLLYVTPSWWCLVDAMGYPNQIGQREKDEMRKNLNEVS